MTSLRIIVASDPSRLLAHAADGLFPLAAATVDAPWPTLRAWVVLRQGGLRDDFHALAARAGVPGWFDPPVCLFSELVTRWGPPGDRALSEEERLALLTGLLARHGAGVFDRAGSSDSWVPAVDRMLSELVGESIAPAAFRAALLARPGRDGFERQRDTTLATVYDEWYVALRRLGRTDSRDRLVRLANAITEDPATFEDRLGARRDVRIVGLADLRGGWTALLRALSSTRALDSVTLLVSHPLALPADLDAQILVDSSSTTIVGSLFTGARAAHSSEDSAEPSIALLEAPDVAREIEVIAVRVRALIDAGAAPARIAVLFRQARPGVDAMADALAALGVPVTARRRTALSSTGPARAVRALLNAVVEAWSRHAVLEIAENPLLSLAIDATVLDAAARLQVVASLDDWERALIQLQSRCSARDARQRADERVHRDRVTLPETTRVDATLMAWRAWLPTARALAQSRPMREWFVWLQSVLTSATWGMDGMLAAAPANDAVAWRADVRARDTMLLLAASWISALEAFGDADRVVDAESFASRLALLLATDLIAQPETGFGVVVSEALAGGWRSFDHVFVAGLAAGAFPQRVVSSAVFGDADRQTLVAAGLPLDPPDAWRGREQELFRVLCGAPQQSLTLSWPAMDAEGREVVRSAYVDEVIDVLLERRGASEERALEEDGTLQRLPSQQVLTPGFPVAPRAAFNATIAHARAAAAIERDRSLEITAWNGDIADPVLGATLGVRFDERYVWSATQLEGLAKCAWSWFSERLLRMGERSEATDAIDPSVSGTILHEALERFFERARGRLGGAAVFLQSHDAGWVRPLAREALDAAWNNQHAAQWLGNPAFHGIVRAELSALLEGYLEFEMQFNDKSFKNTTTAGKQIRTGAAEGERRFDDVVLQGDDVTFRLRGTVDRVDRGVDDRIADSQRFVAAIDYKSSVYATPGAGKKAAWGDGVVLQVPLYAAVLRAQFPEATLARFEYRTLRKPQVVHQLQFFGVKGKQGQPTELVPKPEAEEQLQQALDAAGGRIRAVRNGQLPANPAASCGCSPYCPARDACRIPGGPVDVERR